MITDIQKKYLNKILEGEIVPREISQKHSVYMSRIRERVDHMIENSIWLAINMPEVFRDEEWEIEHLGAIKKRRLKALFQIVKLTYPDSDPQLVKFLKTNEYLG